MFGQSQIIRPLIFFFFFWLLHRTFDFFIVCRNLNLICKRISFGDIYKLYKGEKES